MQHYEGTWSWANGSYKGVTAYVLTFGGLEVFPDTRYLKAGGSEADPTYNLIQTEDWPNFGAGIYTTDSLNTAAGTVSIGFPELLQWILDDAATLGKDRAGTLPYLDKDWTGWSVERIPQGPLTPFFGSIYGPIPSYQYVAYKVDPGTGEPVNAGPTPPPGTPPLGLPDPGQVGPNSNPTPPPPGKRPDPPKRPPATPLPAPGPIGDVGIAVGPDEPISSPINDLPGDIIETPIDSGSGDGGDGGDPADQPLVNWQPVLKQGIDRPNAIFGWEVAPRNVKTMRRLDDGNTTANIITGYGGTPAAETLQFRGDWVPATRYFVNQFVTTDSEGILWKAVRTHTGGSNPDVSTTGDWDLVEPYLGPWAIAYGPYAVGQAVTNGGNLYFVKVAHISGVTGAEPGVGANWRNYWWPVNEAGGQTQLTYTATDQESVDLIGKFYDTENYSFATDLPTLKAMVEASLRRRRFGTQLITFEASTGHPALPKPWADFDKGDTVRVRAGRRLRGGLPARILNAFGRPLEKQRVNGWDIEITDEGAEKLAKVYTEEDLG